MKLYEIKSLDELKALGKHKDIAEQLKEILGKEIKIRTKSWQDLYNAICSNRDLIKNVSDKASKKKGVKYFISEEAEIIFYLLELDGESRAKKLEINKSHYSNKKKAADWRNGLAKVIHPDVCSHPKANEASSKLNSIYQEMLGHE